MLGIVVLALFLFLIALMCVGFSQGTDGKIDWEKAFRRFVTVCVVLTIILVFAVITLGTGIDIL